MHNEVGHVVFQHDHAVCNVGIREDGSIQIRIVGRRIRGKVGAEPVTEFVHIVHLYCRVGGIFIDEYVQDRDTAHHLIAMLHHFLLQGIAIGVCQVDGLGDDYHGRFRLFFQRCKGRFEIRRF